MTSRNRILAIETSCDETAAAVVESGNVILSSIVASQTDLHSRYGGVFPEVASRKHVEVIQPVITQALENAHLSAQDVDAIAVTRGPGLAGSLVVGINAAKALAYSLDKPLIGVNHLEGHVYSLWFGNEVSDYGFPIVTLIVSGGHTELLLMDGHLSYRRLGGTLDDAAGEAFDKIGRLLGLPYPGGPSIDRVAKEGNSHSFRFPRAVLAEDFDFSFSGLKTAVIRETERYSPGRQPIADLAASFQEAVVDVLVSRCVDAADSLGAAAIHVAGGVSANSWLQEALRRATDLPVRFPPPELCTDNAAMIAAAGYQRLMAGESDGLEMDAAPNWPLVR